MAYIWLVLIMIIIFYKICNLPIRVPYSRSTLLFTVKTIIFYMMIAFRKRKNNKTAGYGASSYEDVKLMELPQTLPTNIKAIDAVFFSGANSQGWSLILAMQRRPNRVSTILAYVKIPGEGIYVPKSHPDCLSFRKEENIFKSGGLEISMVKPMERWSLEFNGILQKTDLSGIEKEAILHLEFNSKLRHFDFDKDMDQWATSQAFAREPWSRSFFNNLKAHHQTHYEQMGELSGTANINGNLTSLHMPAFRDHSYGASRDWSLMHRYIFHHIFMDDGSKGVVGVVCQPSTCTRLVCGHWWLPNGEGHPLSGTDLQLEDHGEGGNPPSDYAFQFTAGGIQRTIEVKAEDSAIHYLGWDWEAKFHEIFVEYNVNGIRGRGICEWEYHNHTGRPSRYTDKDPNWTKSLRLEYLTT